MNDNLFVKVCKNMHKNTKISDLVNCSLVYHLATSTVKDTEKLIPDMNSTKKYLTLLGSNHAIPVFNQILAHFNNKEEENRKSVESTKNRDILDFKKEFGLLGVKLKKICRKLEIKKAVVCYGLNEDDFLIKNASERGQLEDGNVFFEVSL